MSEAPNNKVASPPIGVCDAAVAIEATEVPGLKTGLQVSLMVALQIAANFAVQWYVVSRLGAGTQTDAFYAGATLPQIAISVGVDTLAYVLVPLLTAMAPELFLRSRWPVFLGTGVVSALIALALYGITPFALPLIVAGYSPAAKELTVELARIQLLTIPGATCYVVLCAISNVKRRFVWPLLSNALASAAGMVLLVLLLPRFGIVLASWVQVWISAAPVLLLLQLLGPPHRPLVDMQLLRQVWRRMQPLVLGTAYFRCSVVVDRLLTSFLPAGSLVMLSLAQRVHGAIARILNQGIVTPVVPALSTLAYTRQWREFRTLLRRKSAAMLALNAAMVAGLAAVWGFMPHIIEHMPSRLLTGQLSAGELQQLLLIFLLSSGLLLCSGLNHTFTTAFYASGNTATPAKIGVVAYTLGIALKIAGFFLAGIIGMAVALSVHNLVHIALLHYYLRREHSKRETAVPELSPEAAFY
jgi:peptidoglycan biosynthesis protein MviN/MurJ (putative lipid II flippase)